MVFSANTSRSIVLCIDKVANSLLSRPHDHATEVAKLKKWLKERFTYLDTVINAYPEKTY